MGVQGLKSYIESSKNYLRSWAFRDNRLIIDGCNLFYLLYFDCKLDQMYGGDYDAFEELIIQFFKNLAACDIRPYVVLDGGTDHTDKKLDTIMKRKQQKINTAYALSIGKTGRVLPMLVNKVFRQLLHKLKVPLVQCLEEADWEIAALAKEWNCPVLSDDSDFYIFNLKAEFLPITHFQWKNVSVDRRTNQKFIEVKYFTVGHFCESIKMNADLLPLFASISGNDYVKLPNIKGLEWEEYSVTGMKNTRIDGLLNWLSKFPGPEEAMSDLLKYIDNKEKAIIKEALLKGMEEYKLISGSLAQFFNSNAIPQIALTGPLQVLPKWTLKPLLEGRMSSTIIDVLLHQRLFLISQVENFKLPCSSETSRPIRQVIYGLLLLREKQTADKQALKIFTGTSKRYVEEYGRQELMIGNQKVEAKQTRVMEELQLDTLWKEPHDVRLQVLLDTLGVSSTMLRGIPGALQLQMLATRYWLVNAQPQPCQLHLWGLLLGMVYGKLRSTHKTERDMLFRLKLQTGRGKILEEEAAHLYSQWQSCLTWSLNLNCLLCLPLSEPECACLYRGTLVHEVVRELRRGIALESLLMRGSSAEQLFKQLKDAIVSLVGEDFIKKMKTGLECKTQSGYKGQNQSIDDLSSWFEHLMSEDIDDNEDDDLDWNKRNSMAIRTRHKAKARNAYNPSKKYDRRCFDL